MNNIKKVVILENEGIIALDLKALLGKSFDSVKVVKDFSALNKMLASEVPDLIIIDSAEDNLPEKVLSVNRMFRIPMVILTDLPENMRGEINIKDLSFIKKPFHKKDIVNLLNGYSTSSRMPMRRGAVQ